MWDTLGTVYTHAHFADLCLPLGYLPRQGNRLFISCSDADQRLESDRITGS